MCVCAKNPSNLPRTEYLRRIVEILISELFFSNNQQDRESMGEETGNRLPGTVFA
jgi:hypothetical protein